MEKRTIILISVLLILTVMTSCVNRDSSDNYDIQDLQDVGPNKSEELEAGVIILDGYVVDSQQYHYTESVGEYVYTIYERVDENNNWTKSLWRFSPYEEAMLIVEGNLLDFRVTGNNEYIAVESDNKIMIYNRFGEVIKDDINMDLDEEVQLECWNKDGDTLWYSIKDLYTTLAYISIDTETWESKKYDDRQFFSDEYILNPNISCVAYTNYPVLFDSIAVEEFLDSGTVISLNIYNLETKEDFYVASRISEKFEPYWSSDNQLEYINQGRTQSVYFDSNYEINTQSSINNSFIFSKVDEDVRSSVEFVDISSQVVELSIPDSWLYEVDRPDDEGLPNGDPLEGILVSVDGNLNDTIYIFESVGHYNTQGEYFVKTFELDTGLSGLMYFLFYEENIEMQVIFEDGFKGVSINMAVETFLDYESEIYYVLKSIRYLE